MPMVGARCCCRAGYRSKSQKDFQQILFIATSCFVSSHSSGKTIYGQKYQKLDQHSVSGPKTKLLCGFISASLPSKSASFCGDSWKKSPSCCSRWLLQGRTWCGSFPGGRGGRLCWFGCNQTGPSWWWWLCRRLLWSGILQASDSPAWLRSCSPLWLLFEVTITLALCLEMTWAMFVIDL